jgi:hypothetical protein
MWAVNVFFWHAGTYHQVHRPRGGTTQENTITSNLVQKVNYALKLHAISFRKEVSRSLKSYGTLAREILQYASQESSCQGMQTRDKEVNGDSDGDTT